MSFLPSPNNPALSDEALGQVISVNGSRAAVGLVRCESLPDSTRATVGRLLRINAGRAVAVGVVTDISLQADMAMRQQGYHATASVDLMGEIVDGEYRKGLTEYPTIGDEAALLGHHELKIVYGGGQAATVKIGSLQHDTSIEACLLVDETISKHFAVLGATGVGKSSAVALMLRKFLDLRPDLRVLMIDVHNEYDHCFGNLAQALSPSNLRLPFWLFNFEEIVDIIFGGRPGIEDEVEILFETIPIAKAQYRQYGQERAGLKKADPRSIGYNVDTPVPYRLADLVALIDERLGRLENRSSRLTYHRLLTRIETVSKDPRYAFMFDNANVGGDTMSEVLAQIFRLPSRGVPVTVMQLAGFPAEVVDAVVSVLCRMAYDFGLWSDGIDPMLLVCEEAHLYASADRSVGFGPTRRAISRIAKEGRKYGVFLGLVTQRPAELDPTIISQCSTIFAMRMANERDQEILRSAIPDTGSNLIAFLPSLGTGEMLTFGEGIALPARIKVDELPPGLLHKRGASVVRQVSLPRDIDRNFIDSVVERWRGATMSTRLRADDTPDAHHVPSPAAQPAAAAAPPLAPGMPAAPGMAPVLAAPPALDPNRFKTLRKPVETATTPAPPASAAPVPPGFPPRTSVR